MSNDLNLKIFSLNDGLVKQFIQLPYQLNEQYSYWIAPLQIQQKDILKPSHPFWRSATCQLALVFKQSMPAGRVAIIFSISKNKIARAHFGFFDCINDVRVSNMLFQFLKQTTSEKGLHHISGPFNPGFNYELGLLTEGNNRFPKFMMPWNPSYYGNHFLKDGWQVEKTFFAYDLPVRDFLFPLKMQRIKNYLSNHYRIRFRNMDFRKLKSETKLISSIYNEAFKTHWGFQHFSLAELQLMAKDLKFIADPNLMFFIYLNEQVAGFIIALPDLNEVLLQIPKGKNFPFGWWKLLNGKRHIKQVRVLNAAVIKQYKNRGIGALIYHELHRRMKVYNYESGELSWVADDNISMNNAVQALGANIIKTYQIYGCSF